MAQQNLSGLRLVGALATFVVLFSAASCSSSSNDAAGGCATDNDCKGDRVCTDGQCVTPDEATGGSGSDPGKASGGSSDDSNNADGDGTACKLSSEDCDPDCQASCGSPSCVELCCKTVESPGVTCGGVCRPEGTKKCGSVCVDTTSDAENCGECGTVCARPQFVGCRLSKCEKPSL